MPQLIGIAPIFNVRDVKKTAEYYRDTLGFRILNAVGEPPVYAMVERDGCQVHFGKADGDVVHTNAGSRTIGSDCVIWVPEIEVFFAELQSKGVDIVQEIVQRPYGREFIVRDCDGRKIMVVD